MSSAYLGHCHNWDNCSLGSAEMTPHNNNINNNSNRNYNNNYSNNNNNGNMCLFTKLKYNF